MSSVPPVEGVTSARLLPNPVTISYAPVARCTPPRLRGTGPCRSRTILPSGSVHGTFGQGPITSSLAGASARSENDHHASRNDSVDRGVPISLRRN